MSEADRARRLLDVRGLCVSFGSGAAELRAVRSLDLHLDRGETLAVVGESGSGKSVTSLAIMRLVEYGGGRITAGEIELTGRDGRRTAIHQASDDDMRRLRGADMSMIFQEPMTSLNPVFTVGAQIIEAIELHQAGGRAAAVATAVRMLDRVRIPDARGLMKRYPHELSGGMRQRVMIAMALACEPSVLIADEPTTALDVTIQAQILLLIRELQQDMAMGVIFITHDMGVVAEMADRVMVMRHGEVLERDTVHAVFERPAHAYTRTLLAAVAHLGAMTGSDRPARFALPGETETETETKTETGAGASRPVRPSPPVRPARAPGSEPLLQVRDLTTRFDLRSGILSRVTRRVHAVEKVSFDLHAGETLSLVGESGCGKTTTGRSLLSLARSCGGSIRFEGQPVLPTDKASLNHLRRHVQFVFQDPFASLNPRMRVGDCIREPMLIQGMAAGDDRVARLMERVGLDPATARRWPHEFSGGQRQRICIARALSVDPQVLIADEAVSALDVSIRAQIVNLLIDLQDELGIACLFISHDMAVVERISHRVAVMYLGQIVEIGPRRAVFENPQHAYTRRLLAAVPKADPRARHRIEADAGDIPSPIRNRGDEPEVPALVQVGEAHFVARHRVGGLY